MIVERLVQVIELAGIFVLLVGIVVSSAAFAKGWLSTSLSDAYHGYRANLGRAMLLGLEFLVVADVISTVAIEATYESVAVLAVLVLVRTFLSFALEVEITGQLPWRRGPDLAPHEPMSER